MLVVILTVIIASFVLGSAASNMDVIAKGLGASASFFAIIDRVPLIDSSSTIGSKPDDYDGTLTLNDVHFRYQNNQFLFFDSFYSFFVFFLVFYSFIIKDTPLGQIKRY